MRFFYLFIIAFLSFGNTANASVYVVYDKATKEVKSVSDQDDAVLEQGWDKEILPGDVKQYELVYPSQFYKLVNKKFIANIKKLSDESNREQAQISRLEEMDLIKAHIYKVACEEMLSNDPNIFKEIKCEDFK